MDPKRSLSALVLCLFLMVGLSWEVNAFSRVGEDLSGANSSDAYLR